jgi:erythronate-4-phosphate dehydrogenase
MTIVADENIAMAAEAFSHLGDVILKPGREITSSELQEADALIVRSVTEVNSQLLNNSKVSFVGTATIGTDHIDIDYLNSAGISFASAKGCNADAVTEYIFTVIIELVLEEKINFPDFSMGIIGAGNIGSRVAKIASSAGIKTVINDPPLELINPNPNYVSLDEALAADVITFHVPLNLTGPYRTYHLIDEGGINSLNSEKIIINTSRGAVIDNKALSQNIELKKLTTILDVWENEPNINKELLYKAFIATPHIAGYSAEGKINGTYMIYKSLCKHFNTKPEWYPNLPSVDEAPIESDTFNFIKKVYDIRKDDQELKQYVKIVSSANPHYFDVLRKNYKVRREFPNYSLKAGDKLAQHKDFLRALRFNLI